MHFVLGDLTPVSGRGPQELNYPLTGKYTMHRLGDFYKEVLQQELYEIKEPEEIYYDIDINDETKREVNPFKLRNFLSDKCN